MLASTETNYWVHRHGRNYLRARDYLEDFEKVYGASGILPALDGADHFRFRKAMNSAYSRSRLESHMEPLYHHARTFMSDWSVGDSLPAVRMCRLMINSEMSPISVSVDSQDIIDDLIEYKTRAPTTHVLKVMPKFMLNTPGMRRRKKGIAEPLGRVQSVHTPAQRAGCLRDLTDDLLSLYASDPQFLPESNLRFALSAPLIASIYLGDALSFAVYAMASQPEFYNRIQSEADTLFADGNPDREAYTPEATDVTRRFIRDHRKTLPLDDQGGIKGGLDRASHVETGNPLLRYAAPPPFATQKGEVLRGSLSSWRPCGFTPSSRRRFEP